MRGFVRAISLLLVFLAPFLLSPTAFSQERRLVVTEGADYFGSDYDVRKDVDLDQCKAACQGDKQCQAFTYNSSARWCFLKNGVGELRAVAGAVSGRIVAASAAPRPDVAAAAHQRARLPRSVLCRRGAASRRPDLRQARLRQRFRQRRRRRPVGQGQRRSSFRARSLYRCAEIPARRFRALDALRRTPRSMPRATTTRCSRRSRPTAPPARSTPTSTPSRRRNARRRSTDLGWSLGNRYDWKQSIRAYRASLALVENDPTSAPPTIPSLPSTASASSTTSSKPTPPHRASA